MSGPCDIEERQEELARRQTGELHKITGSWEDQSDRAPRRMPYVPRATTGERSGGWYDEVAGWPYQRVGDGTIGILRAGIVTVFGRVGRRRWVAKLVGLKLRGYLF